MRAIKEIEKRLQAILEELDELADQSGDEALEDMNAELEDALFMLSEIDMTASDGREELEDALETLEALRDGYADRPDTAEVAERMEGLLRMAGSIGGAKKGRLIVIEGLDGSGKATQAGLLTEALKAMGQRVRAVSFPNYQSDSSALVRMYLAGAFGQDPSDVNAYAASSFYAVDRFAGYKADWGGAYRKGGVIVADRYTTSNAVHQCSKLPREAWDGFLDWLFDYEYRLLGIPAPDLVIYLRVAPEVSQALMKRRYAGDETRRDIHERNVEYQRHSREAADYCAGKLKWRTVECTREGGMRTAEAIHAEIMELVRAIL